MLVLIRITACRDDVAEGGKHPEAKGTFRSIRDYHIPRLDLDNARYKVLSGCFSRAHLHFVCNRPVVWTASRRKCPSRDKRANTPRNGCARHGSSRSAAPKRRHPAMIRNPKNHELDKQCKSDKKTPPAGPHGKPELTDPEKAPGTGILPEEDQPDVEGPTG